MFVTSWEIFSNVPSSEAGVRLVNFGLGGEDEGSIKDAEHVEKIKGK